MSRLGLWAHRMREKTQPTILDIGGKPSPTDNDAREVPTNTSGYVSLRHLVPDSEWIVADVEPGTGVDVVADIHSIDSIGRTFDGVLCCFVLEHVRRPWIAIEQISRALNPGGLAYVQTHHSFPLHYYPDDFYRFSTAAMATMLMDAGLSVGHVGYYSPCVMSGDNWPKRAAQSVDAWACVEAMGCKGVYRMRIGLDLDGTVYAYPALFGAMIAAMTAAGHQFYCTSSHGRDEWRGDCERLRNLGIDPGLISPELLYPQRHGDLAKKARQADQLDVVFDDDGRIARMTQTPVICPSQHGGKFAFQQFTA